MRYRFYTDDKNTTYVVTSYAGKPVRAKAKCDPRDGYNRVIGEGLAAARVDVKVAEKRYSNAQRKYNEAMENAFQAQKHLIAMEEYLHDSTEALCQAETVLNDMLKTI